VHWIGEKIRIHSGRARGLAGRGRESIAMETIHQARRLTQLTPDPEEGDPGRGLIKLITGLCAGG